MAGCEEVRDDPHFHPPAPRPYPPPAAPQVPAEGGAELLSPRSTVPPAANPTAWRDLLPTLRVPEAPPTAPSEHGLNPLNDHERREGRQVADDRRVADEQVGQVHPREVPDAAPAPTRGLTLRRQSPPRGRGVRGVIRSFVIRHVAKIPPIVARVPRFEPHPVTKIPVMALMCRRPSAGASRPHLGSRVASHTGRTRRLRKWHSIHAIAAHAGRSGWLMKWLS